MPTKVDFGPGRIKDLCEEVVNNGFKKAVFVVTAGRKQSGMLDAPITSLAGSGVEVNVYDGVKENPDIQSVKNCVGFLKQSRPHVIIGLGGGSTLDTAKAAGICYSNGSEDLMELVQQNKMVSKAPPTILVPTTSGSGTEVNFWAVVTNKKTKQKISVGNPLVSPFMALIDPLLTVSVPPLVTLMTGMDALTHAVESYLSQQSSRFSELLSYGAVSLIVESLEEAVEEGSSITARCNMSLGSFMAGAAMENAGLGLIHAMSHQVSGFYNTAHGLVNAFLLPHVLGYNRPLCRHKMNRLDNLVGTGNDMVEWAERLIEKYNLKNRMIGIRGKDLKTMCSRAIDNVNARTNPRQPQPEDVQKLYKSCFNVT
ncbi:MAG: iron-containing alcohol dehydrogenase family protein [Spirochaetota bacterium]